MVKIAGTIRNEQLVVELSAPASEFDSLKLQLAVALKSDDGVAGSETVKVTFAEAQRSTAADGVVTGTFTLPANHFKQRIVSVDYTIEKKKKALKKAEIETKGWYFTHLLIPDRKTFDAVMKYTYLRIDDKETLLHVVRETAMSRDIDVAIRIACFVVYCYKAIELGFSDDLKRSFALFAEFESGFEPLKKLNKKGVRENGEQLILSLMTVKWHAGIFLGDAETVETTLDFIVDNGKDSKIYRNLTFSTNFANSALLRGWILFISGRHERAAVALRALYDQAHAVATDLPEEFPNHVYLREFAMSLERVTYGAEIHGYLRDELWKLVADGTASPVQKKHHSEFMLRATDAKALRLCSRVTGDERFNAQFMALMQQFRAQDAKAAA